ncbi:hypothetical protein [Pinirhizobacter soli]|uniref:hypothetical protein n=1 Tax=Pinirhizobacter soli TaxID=2786953 RepID=UPI002029F4CA|nr:hypothetical protein [Pinirhizobacter soli]
MNLRTLSRTWAVPFLLTVVGATATGAPPAKPEPASTAPAVTERDGSHDFDWEIGTWATSVKVLRNPLSPKAAWVEFNGTSVIHALGGGRANLVDLDVSGPVGRIQGVSLRLYNVQARQWGLNFANMGDGLLTPPSVGEFKNGRGEFYGTDTLRGRTILVRFVILDVTPDSARFEQSYSADGGKTWELNWIATDRRLPAKP